MISPFSGAEAAPGVACAPVAHTDHTTRRGIREWGALPIDPRTEEGHSRLSTMTAGCLEASGPFVDSMCGPDLGDTATHLHERREVLTDTAREFLSEYHLATLSTIGRDGRIHSVPVGMTYLDGIVRVIGSGGSQKFLNAERSGRASVNTLDGRRWISFEGPARVRTDAESVALAVELYAARYRQPRVNPQRVVLELTVERVLGSAGMRVSE